MKTVKKGKLSLFAWFCFGFLVLTSFIGNLFIITVVHEYQHMYEYRATNFELENESIIINIPLNVNEFGDLFKLKGTYSASVNHEDYLLLEKEVKYTEYKAYAVSIILILILTIFILVVLNELLKKHYSLLVKQTN